ncbi:uncharacterized protein V6R79_017802 [Siganus canaliculatus]
MRRFQHEGSLLNSGVTLLFLQDSTSESLSEERQHTHTQVLLSVFGLFVTSSPVTLIAKVGKDRCPSAESPKGAPQSFVQNPNYKHLSFISVQTAFRLDRNRTQSGFEWMHSSELWSCSR